jgi:replicative DNA helicase
MTEPVINDIYALQDEYAQYRKIIQDTGGFDLAKWLPKFSNSVPPMFPGELVVIMADTGVGKTAILQNIAKAARGYGDVLLFELELPGTLCFERFAALSTGMTQISIAARYDEGGKVLVGDVDHVYVCDTPGLTLDQMYDVAAEAKQASRKYDVVMIDYIGLIESTAGRSRYERMSDTAEKLKTFARSLDVVVVVATQIHRKGDDYVDQIGLHDAKDSGSIENVADLLLGAWRDLDEPSKICMKILKNRKGHGGDVVEGKFSGNTMRITPWRGEVDF